MKNLVRKLFNMVGYDIVKAPLYSDSRAGKSVKVQVGDFTVYMPGNNPHISEYKYRPDTNKLQGILASQVSKKYPGMSLIDIGANVGDTIAVVKTAVDIPIIGIEGDPVSYSYLEKNTSQFRNVTIIQEFLGEKSQTIQVTLEKKGWNATLIPSENQGQQVQLKTLDQVLAENKLTDSNIKVLKIDTEGFDTIILRGAIELLRKHKPALFFEYNRSNMEAIKEDGLSTLLSLEQSGYRSVIFFDNYGRYILNTPITMHDLIKQLHAYSEDEVSQIGFFDVCLFHENDQDIEDLFIKTVSSSRR